MYRAIRSRRELAADWHRSRFLFATACSAVAILIVECQGTTHVLRSREVFGFRYEIRNRLR